MNMLKLLLQTSRPGKEKKKKKKKINKNKIVKDFGKKKQTNKTNKNKHKQTWISRVFDAKSLVLLAERKASGVLGKKKKKKK